MAASRGAHRLPFLAWKVLSALRKFVSLPARRVLPLAGRLFARNLSAGGSLYACPPVPCYLGSVHAGNAP